LLPRNSKTGQLLGLSILISYLSDLDFALTAIQFRAEPGAVFLHVTIRIRKLVDEVSADSGLQLDLEIALSVVSAKVQPHELFSSAEDALKRRVT